MKKDGIKYILFAAYILFMLWLLFGMRLQNFSDGAWTENYRQNLIQRINLVPLRTIGEFLENLRGGGRSHAIFNLFGNVILFVPLGFFIPLIFPKVSAFRRCMLSALIVLICVEILQLAAMLGSLDVDDMILNMCGTAVGYILFRIVSRTA